MSHGDLRKVLQQDHLRILPNLDQLTTKFHKAALKPVEEVSVASCSLEDVHSLHKGLIEVCRLTGVLELIVKQSNETNEATTLDRCFVIPLKKSLKKLNRFHDLVAYTFDKREMEKGNYLINRDFDAKLNTLAENKDHLWRAIEIHRTEVENDLKLSGGVMGKKNKVSAMNDGQAVKIVECNSVGFVFRVTKKDQRIVQVREIPTIAEGPVRLWLFRDRGRIVLQSRKLFDTGAVSFPEFNESH